MRKVWCLTKLTFILFVSICYGNVSLKPYEQWWQRNINTSYSQLLAQIHHYNSQSRVIFRNYVCEKKYKRILDVGCGKGIEWEGFLHDKIDIYYQGIDITPGLVLEAQKNNINIIEGSIEKIPFTDDSFDIAYTRHVLEHLPSYEKAIDELLRVAYCEVFIIFFIQPHNKNKDFINLINFQGSLLYNNHYSKKKLETYILSKSKVQYISWQCCSAQEEILHMFLK